MNFGGGGKRWGEKYLGGEKRFTPSGGKKGSSNRRTRSQPFPKKKGVSVLPCKRS